MKTLHSPNGLGFKHDQQINQCMNSTPNTNIRKNANNRLSDFLTNNTYISVESENYIISRIGDIKIFMISISEYIRKNHQ